MEDVATTTENSQEFSAAPNHEDVVLTDAWWWAAIICLSAVGFTANLLFLVTIIYNRKRRELQTFVTAVITAVAFLDIVDVTRVLPVLCETLYETEIFRHVYCSLGVFHELSVAIFIVAICIAVCAQAGKESKLYKGCPALAHKILVPAVVLASAGAAAPLFLAGYARASGHACTDPFRALETSASPPFGVGDAYALAVAAVTLVLPAGVAGVALPLAGITASAGRTCCAARHKQPVGELIMAAAVAAVYIATFAVAVVVPRLADVMELEPMRLGPAPLLWEMGNNAARPLIYFMTNPAVWDGLRSMCCRKTHQLVDNVDDDEAEEAEVPLAPVTTV